MLKYLKALSLFALAAGPAFADGYGLGRAALPDEIAAWDIDVRPDGLGLPEGRGNALDGEEIFTEQCAACHGDFGEAVGRWPVLAGGQDTLTSDRPVKTIGSYWPYLSTVYDYVNRAMPFGNAQSLSNDEVYAITAYLLYLNDLVEDDFELSHENFAEVRLPNEDSFYLDDREELELASFSGEVCMENCKDDVRITMRARVLDVTPDENGAEEAQVEEQLASTETQATEEPPAAEINAELAEAGQKVFRKCKACHQVGPAAKNRTGPHLNGVVGRTAGELDGFRYSDALASAGGDGFVWTEETLAAFLANPRSNMPGTKMAFAGLKDPTDTEAVIEYLRTFSE